MTVMLREQGIVTVHDQVVSLVAQRWAKAFRCKVTIHTSLDQNPWADPQQQCDIVGWHVSSGGFAACGGRPDGTSHPATLLDPLHDVCRVARGPDDQHRGE